MYSLDDIKVSSVIADKIDDKTKAWMSLTYLLKHQQKVCMFIRSENDVSVQNAFSFKNKWFPRDKPNV
jgi:hypothetical protein